MLLLAPEVVRFESFVWEDVASIAIDRAAKRVVEEFSDAGPFATMVDVPEQSITVRVQRRITGDDVDGPALAAAGELVCYIGPGAAAGGRRRVTIACVLIGVRSELPSGKDATRTLTFLCTSDGTTDPITITPASDL